MPKLTRLAALACIACVTSSAHAYEKRDTWRETLVVSFADGPAEAVQRAIAVVYCISLAERV